MREIKFRAWNKNTKKMVCPHKLTPLALHPDCLDLDGVFIPFHDDYILMQFTGLPDKSGKEIYEGDIVRNGKGIIYEVRWYNFGFHFDTPKINGCWTSYTLETYEHLHWSGPSVSPGTEEPKHYKDWHIEIIGNIYENVHG